MESAPQSTITHNAVIDVASDFLELPPRLLRERGRRIKRRPTLPKRAASNLAGPCQNRLPGATPGGAKNVDFRKESGVKPRQIADPAEACRWNSCKNQKPA